MRNKRDLLFIIEEVHGSDEDVPFHAIERRVSSRPVDTGSVRTVRSLAEGETVRIHDTVSQGFVSYPRNFRTVSNLGEGSCFVQTLHLGIFPGSVEILSL